MDAHTHTRGCSGTQKNKHTQGFGVLVSICGEAILSLSLSLSLALSFTHKLLSGGVLLWSCDTSLLLLLQFMCVYVCAWVRASACICMCASLLMCIHLIVCQFV